MARMTVILTPNLRLEPLRKGHAALLLQPLGDAQLYALMPQDQPQSLEDLEKRYAFLELGKSPDGKEHWLNWTIFDRRFDKPLGTFQATVRDDGPSGMTVRQTSPTSYLLPTGAEVLPRRQRRA